MRAVIAIRADDDPATAAAALAHRVAPVVSFPATAFGPDATGRLGRRDGPAFRFPAKLAPRVGVALQVVQPFADPQLLPTTPGGRPGRSVAHALARAEHLAARGGRWAWATADVRKAFDTVPQEGVVRSLRRWLGVTPLTARLETLVRSDVGVGIRQGGPLSPLLLNLYLHDTLDAPWQSAHPDRPLIRWVDDVLILTRDAKEAHHALSQLNARLDAAGLRPKDDPPPAAADLSGGGRVGWLGFEIGKDGDRLRLAVSDRAWRVLGQKLREARTGHDPEATVLGWANDFGAAIDPDTERGVADRLVSQAERAGHHGRIDRAEVARRMAGARRRLDGLRAATAGNDREVGRERTDQRTEPVAAPPATTEASIVPPPGAFRPGPARTPPELSRPGAVTPPPGRSAVPTDRGGPPRTTDPARPPPDAPPRRPNTPRSRDGVPAPGHPPGPPPASEPGSVPERAGGRGPTGKRGGWRARPVRVTGRDGVSAGIPGATGIGPHPARAPVGPRPEATGVGPPE